MAIRDSVSGRIVCSVHGISFSWCVQVDGHNHVSCVLLACGGAGVARAWKCVACGGQFLHSCGRLVKQQVVCLDTWRLPSGGLAVWEMVEGRHVG